MSRTLSWAAAFFRKGRPFTLNGFAVREAFFVSVLGTLGVDPGAAFAAGFLFVAMVVLTAPGAAILACTSARAAEPSRPHG